MSDGRYRKDRLQGEVTWLPALIRDGFLIEELLPVDVGSCIPQRSPNKRQTKKVTGSPGTHLPDVECNVGVLIEHVLHCSVKVTMRDIYVSGPASHTGAVRKLLQMHYFVLTNHVIPSCAHESCPIPSTWWRGCLCCAG